MPSIHLVSPRSDRPIHWNATAFAHRGHAPATLVPDLALVSVAARWPAD